VLFRDLTFLKLHDKMPAMDILSLKRKKQVIAKVLIAHGIPIWYGIPDHIVDALREEGYVIRKKKGYGKD
jgi:hypothetical protein